MPIRTLIPILASSAFLFLIGAASPARADVTLTGTAGEIGIVTFNQGSGPNTTIRFKFTDLNQTKTCIGNATYNTGTGYAWFYGLTTGFGSSTPDPAYKEWYAALLVSKKGVPITCTVDSATDCHVTGCTLP